MPSKILIGTVTSKGQVTIPKPLRDSLGIRAGERLEFQDAGDGRIVARKAGSADAVDSLYGVLHVEEPVDALVERMRGKGDAV